MIAVVSDVEESSAQDRVYLARVHTNAVPIYNDPEELYLGHMKFAFVYIRLYACVLELLQDFPDVLTIIRQVLAVD